MASETSHPPQSATTMLDRLVDRFFALYLRVTPIGLMLGGIVILLAVVGVYFQSVSEGLEAGTTGYGGLLGVIIGGTLALGLLMGVLPELARASHQRRHSTARLLGGGAWAHWRYTDDDRRRIAAAGLVPQPRLLPIQSAISLLILLVVVVVVMASLGLPLVALLCAVGLLGIALPLALPPYLRAQRRHALHAAGPREVYLSPEGVVEDGLYVPIGGSLAQLPSGVVLERGPLATLSFSSVEVHQLQTAGRGLIFLPGPTVRVAVPQGKEEEAAALAERFRALL